MPKQDTKRTITQHAARWQPVRSDGDRMAHAAPDDCPAVPRLRLCARSARPGCSAMILYICERMGETEREGLGW
jgi:hypothetical protein